MAAADETPPRKMADYYVQAGDFDGDGVRDLFVDRTDVTNGCCTTSVIAVSGADGSTLWTRDLDDWFFSGAVPATVGPGGQAGVLLVDVTRSYSWVDEVTLTLTALDGRGQQLWTSEVTGTIIEQPASFAALHADGIPVGSFLGDVTGDGAQDIRVMLADQLLEGTALEELAVRSVVVDGATGAISETSDEIAIEGALALERLPDITSDGRRDIAVLDVAAEGTLVRGYDGVSGEQVWQTDSLDLYSFYVYDEYLVWLFGDVFSSVGDVTGDGAAEVVVTQWDRDGQFAFDTVVDGATGTHGLTSDGATVYRLGDINDDGIAEVGLAALYEAVDESFFARYDAANFAGARQRRTEHHVPAGVLMQASLQLGELNGDSATDAMHRLATDAGADRAIISGKTADTLWEPPSSGSLLRSLDGRGVDLLSSTTTGEGAVGLDARDGATGAQLWEQTLPLPGNATRASIQTLDLDADGRHELLVRPSCPEVNCVYNISPQVRLLDPADGTTRWTRNG